MDLVSCIVPCYNTAKFLPAALDSLILQTYENFEVIVVDDGSTDNSTKIAHDYACQYSQIRLVRQENKGQAAARNAGIRVANGTYVVPLDADDVWYPTALEKLVRRIEQCGSGTAVAYGWSAYIDEYGALTGEYRAAKIEGEVLATLLCHNFLGNGSATLIRKAAIDACGMYALNIPTGCEDWELYLKLASKYRYCVVPEFLIGYRKYWGSTTTNTQRMAKSHAYLLEKAHIDYPCIPRWCYSLSRSSFLLYLAYESRRHDNFKESMRYLWQSLQRGHVFTLLRPTFYGMLYRNSFRTGGPRSGSISSGSPISLEAMCRSRRLWLVVFMQQMLHRFISWVT